MKPSDIFYDIADAIRERGSLSKAEIPVKQFATRINAIVAGTGANPDARRMFHFLNFLTPAEEQSFGLLRCSGQPIYETVHATFHAFLKGAWQSGLVAISPNRVYDTFRAVGTKLYVGSSTALTTILVINTTNGTITTITGLPSRAYTRFELIGTWIYCLHPASSVAAHNTIVAINTATDAVTQITVPNRGYSGFAKIGNRWFMPSRATATTDLVFLDVTSHPGTIGTVPGVTTTSRTQHLIVGGASLNKLYISSPSAATYIAVVDTTRIGGALDPVMGEIHGLPSRIHDAAYSAGRFLYIATSSTTAIDTIVRIDTQTEMESELPVPARKYSIGMGTNATAFTGKLMTGTPGKLYVGADTQATTIVVINNTNGQVNEIGLATALPNRRYLIVDDAAPSFINWNTNWVAESNGQAPHQRLHTTGAKLYLSSSTSGTTLVILNTTTAWVNAPAALTDTFTEITGLASRAYDRFFLYGTTLYLLTSSSGNTIEMLNLSNDTRLTALSNLISRAYGVPFTVGTGAAARLYLGSTGSVNNIPIINLSNNTLVEDVRNLLSATYNILMIYTGKIYVGRTGTQATLLVLSDAVLPSHAQPVYIRPD